MSKKLTQEEFVEKAKLKHNNFFDYSLVEYKNSITKIKIICPLHGIFKQTPASHLRGNSCKKCFTENHKLTTEEFIEKAKKVHENKFDYSKVEYKLSIIPVEIICPIHGSFFSKTRQTSIRKNLLPKMQQRKFI